VIKHGQPVSLNPNHTHFLLVDDGVRGRYQGVAEFRAKLEKKISQPTDATPPEGEWMTSVLLISSEADNSQLVVVFYDLE